MSDEFSIQKDVTIQNIVGSGNLPVEIKTDVLGEALDEKSEGESYTWMDDGPQPGLYYEVGGDDGPQVTFHESGSYIVRADSEEELYETNDKVMRQLADIGVVEEGLSEEDLNFSIQNVVALAKLNRDIKLRALHQGLSGKTDEDSGGSDAQYEPEVFPALEYSTPKYPCSFLVYGNGKIIIAGASSVDQVDEAMEDFYSEMEEVYFSIVDMV
jgi:transcription initiation factor TFIID TATA-box-binding protein